MAIKWVDKACKSCGAQHGEQEALTICDQCKKVCEAGAVVEVKFERPSKLGGSIRHFCSDICFEAWRF